MGPLEAGIQNYAWGSKSHIRALRGEPPAAQPEAEAWFGAHPVLPSTVTWQGRTRGLDELVREEPARMLGTATQSRFGAKLPFLVKLLAADTPLSLQAHPSLAQAQAGFAREESAGIPRAAPNRNYKDDNHKPELLCALTPFSALCGFRTPAQIRALFTHLGVPLERVGLADTGDRDDAATLESAFRALWALDAAARRSLVALVHERALALADATMLSSFHTTYEWLRRIAALYPEDVGVVQTLFLNVIELAPFEAIYLPAGNLHAYLGGFGVEIMASSDNVLRGGLTPKHVDESELLRVLDFTPHADWRVPAQQVENPSTGGAIRYVYNTPAPEFELSRVVLPAGGSLQIEGQGPRIVIATRGTLEVVRAHESITIAVGRGAFVEDGTAFIVSARHGAEGFIASAGAQRLDR